MFGIPQKKVMATPENCELWSAELFEEVSMRNAQEIISRMALASADPTMDHRTIIAIGNQDGELSTLLGKEVLSLSREELAEDLGHFHYDDDDAKKDDAKKGASTAKKWAVRIAAIATAVGAAYAAIRGIKFAANQPRVLSSRLCAELAYANMLSDTIADVAKALQGTPLSAHAGNRLSAVPVFGEFIKGSVGISAYHRKTEPTLGEVSKTFTNAKTSLAAATSWLESSKNDPAASASHLAGVAIRLRQTIGNIQKLTEKMAEKH